MLSGLFKNALLAAGVFGYLLVGAMVFQMLEQEAEATVKEKTLRHQLDFLKNHTCLSKEALETLIEVVSEAVKQGIDPMENGTTHNYSNWDFSSAFFLAGTVVTTIGYGTIAPRTAGGQMFCVVYALFGIPFNLIFLARIGKWVSQGCKCVGKHLVKKGMQKKKAKALMLLFFLVMGIVVFLLFPPFVFQKAEGWSYEEGLYYAFITLSTIGFGDYVVRPGKKMYQILVSFWILFGLAWLSLLINLLMSFLKNTEKRIEKDIHRKVQHRKERHQEKAMLPLTTSCQKTDDSEPLD